MTPNDTLHFRLATDIREIDRSDEWRRRKVVRIHQDASAIAKAQIQRDLDEWGHRSSLWQRLKRELRNLPPIDYMMVALILGVLTFSSCAIIGAMTCVSWIVRWWR